ncbi:hypothetical protein MMC29_004250 [Sticta canariensis]|nr:hypothetical protein [Sticta canariensis]
MRTRSKKIAFENAGGIPSPPQQLPAVQKRTRAPRKKASHTQQEPSIGTEDSKIPNSEAKSSSFVPNVLPVQTRAPTTRLPVPSRLPGPSRPLRVRTPSALSVAPAAQTPTSLGPQTPQALIHIWVDASAEDLASAQPVSDPTILVAVPSDAIPHLLTFIGTLSHRRNELTISAATTTISISPSSNKRKLPADADLAPPAQRARIEPTPAPVRPKARRAFSRDGLTEVRLEPNLQPTPLSHYQPSDTIPDTKFFKRVNRYGPDGNLQLGLEPVSISSEEGSNALFQPSRPVTPPLENQPPTDRPEETTSSDHGPLRDIEEESEITDNVPGKTSIATPLRLESVSASETPRGRGSRWGLGTLVNTARRYLPSLNRRAEPMTPVAEYPVIAPNSIPSFSPDVVSRSALTDPKPKDQSTIKVNAPATTTTAQSREHQEHQERRQRRRHREHNKITSPKRGNKTRNHVQSDRRKHPDDSQAYYIRAQALDSRRKAEMATTPGTKRKRLPSPDTIPNPRGSSYGMDLDYFGFDSSDECDEIDNTPTKPRPSKSRRISEPGDSESSMIGDPQNARPYSGILFAESCPAYHGGNVFGEVKTAEKAMRMASDMRIHESQKQAYLSKTSTGRNQHASLATPISNQTGSFKVPEPSDSDSDPEELARVTSLSSNEKCPSEGKMVPRQMEAPPTTVATTSTGKSPGLWKKSPPPRPTPGHKALPSAPKRKAPETLSSSSHPVVTSSSGSTSSGSRLPAHRVATPPVNRSTDSEALRKVREKALQHKPRKPSTLSQSSRLYSSPLGDSSDETNKSTTQGVTAAQKDIEGKEIPTVGAGTGPDGASHNDDEAPKETGHDEVAAIQADKDFAGTINVDGNSSGTMQCVSPPDWSATWNAYKEYCQKTDPAVAGLLAESKVNVKVMGDVLKSVLSSLSNPLAPVNNYVSDPKVESYIDSKWDQPNRQVAVTVFEMLCADFATKEIADEEAKTAAITAGVAV